MMSEQEMTLPSWAVEVGAELLSGGQVRVRAELSDGSFLQLNRTDEDLAQMMKRLLDGFPDDREMLSRRLFSGLLMAQAADLSSDPGVKVVEVNNLLQAVISLPHKFSQSEAVLAFFERSAADQTFREDKCQKHKPEDQPCRPEQEGDQTCTEKDQDLNVFQSPAALSEVLRSNGFCLANTETILFDLTPPTQLVTQSDDSTCRRVSAVPAVCLQFCRPSVSPHLLRGFTGMMGRLVRRQSSKHKTAPPSCPAPSTSTSTSN